MSRPMIRYAEKKIQEKFFLMKAPGVITVFVSVENHFRNISFDSHFSRSCIFDLLH